MQESDTLPPNTAPDAAPQSQAGAISDIIDVTMASFMKEVIETSRQKLVLVDFWAPWCEPCKQLTPILENCIAQTNGQVRLAKMNIETDPQIAQQMQVQSIPAVFAFKDGAPIDGFVGVLAQADIEKFIATHSGAAASQAAHVEKTIAAGKQALAEGDTKRAVDFFSASLEMDDTNAAALAGLAQCYLANGDTQTAEEILQNAPDTPANQPAHPDLTAARAALELAHKTPAADTAQITALESALAKNENDHQARFDLALLYHGAGDRTKAIAALLDIITRQPDWQDQAARKQLLELFDAYGAEDTATIDGRRKLSSLLFR